MTHFSLDRFTALVHALEETDSVAIVRFVKRKNGTPILGALYPCIKPENEYFYLHKLPYAEDIRQFPFPPLDKFVINLFFLFGFCCSQC